MIFQLPKHNFPVRFIKIHKELKVKGILGDCYPSPALPDEPQFYHYVCERIPYSSNTKKGFGVGCSDSESEAFTAAVAEAIEHYCILFENEKLFIRDSYSNLQEDAVDPLRFVPFSEQQLTRESYKEFRVSHKTPLNWIEGYSLTKKRKVLVPASLVYANYQARARKEPNIQIQISTGAACGPTLEFALYRGICEIIERDAYTISFANGLPKEVIDVDKANSLFAFKRRIERYDLEVHFLSTKLDCLSFTVVCILLDGTGSGPAVSAGLGGSLDPTNALKTAALEAVRRHISVRDKFFRSKRSPMPLKNSPDWFLAKKQILWSAPHMIKTAQSFLSGRRIPFEKLAKHKYPKNDKDRVKFLVDELKGKGYEVLYVDTTIPEVKKLGLTVVKVLIPEMVPLWKDERFPYLGIKRLYSVPGKLGYDTVPKLTQDTFSSHPF